MEIEEKNSSSEGEELILVQTTWGVCNSNFYIVDLKSEKTRRTPVATLLNECGEGSLVALGSVIYNIGGQTSVDDELDPNLNNGVNYLHLGTSSLELRKPHLYSFLEGEDDDDDVLMLGSNKWKANPPMQCNRIFPCCASLGGSIYVMGGIASELCIGEVFNPKLGEWRPLSSPPCDVPLNHYCVTPPLIADEKNKRLLVHFNNVDELYAYYPATDTWDCLAQKFWQWVPATALVDDVLYFHVEQMLDCLLAYDLSSKTWLNVVYSSKFLEKNCFVKYMALFHLGNGVMCFANFLPFFEYDSDGVRSLLTNLQFVKFRVERTSPKELLVTPLGRSRFRFKNYLGVDRFLLL